MSPVSQRGVVFFRAQDDLTNELQKELAQRLGELSGKPSTSSSDLLGLDWTGSGLKSSPLQFYRDLAPGAPYNPYTIYSKSWRPFGVTVGVRTYQIRPKLFI